MEITARKGVARRRQLVTQEIPITRVVHVEFGGSRKPERLVTQNRGVVQGLYSISQEQLRRAEFPGAEQHSREGDQGESQVLPRHGVGRRNLALAFWKRLSRVGQNGGRGVVFEIKQGELPATSEFTSLQRLHVALERFRSGH